MVKEGKKGKKKRTHSVEGGGKRNAVPSAATVAPAAKRVKSEASERSAAAAAAAAGGGGSGGGGGGGGATVLSHPAAELARENALAKVRAFAKRKGVSNATFEKWCVVATLLCTHTLPSPSQRFVSVGWADVVAVCVCVHACACACAVRVRVHVRVRSLTPCRHPSLVFLKTNAGILRGCLVRGWTHVLLGMQLCTVMIRCFRCK